MLIRTKIKLVVVWSVLFVGILYSFIFWFGEIAENRREKENTATQTIKILFEIDVLVNEYLLLPGERTIQQWQEKRAGLDSWLSTTVFENEPLEQELLDKIKQNSATLKTSFEELVAVDNIGFSNLDTEIIRNRLVSELSRLGNSMVGDALLLTEKLRVGEIKIQESTNKVVMAIVVVALLMGFYGSRVLIRNIASPLKELSDFAAKVSRGKFTGVISPDLLKQKDEFGQLGKLFNDMVQDLEVLDRAKTEFISIASHQLRTPISGLNWLTEALQYGSENLNPKQKTYVRDLAMLSKRLVSLVEDLLNISRIELKTALITEKSQIDIYNFLEEFVKEMEPYAKSKKHTIVFNKSIARPFTIEVNKKSLYNILQNLVSNAIEYSPENTAVTINLEKASSTSSPQADGFIKISISNKGPVILKDEQTHLFERFYRGESAKKMKAEGTGLGLYIIKMIIEEMGGKVGFVSEEGKDTTFWFSIPLKGVIIDKSTVNKIN